MSVHISLSTIFEYLGSTLSPEEAAKVAEHLASPCEACRIQVQRAEEMLDLLTQPERTTIPPANVVKRALGLLNTRPVQRPLRQVIADLVYDSFRQPSLAAMRGAPRSRQLLFSAGELDIDMQITPERDSATLIGQVLTRTAAVLGNLPIVRLYQAGEVIDTSYSDPLGQFAFRAVPPGRYDVGVWVDPQMVVIKDVEFQHD